MMKFCRLYRDRLDFWARSGPAMQGFKAEGCIQLGDVVGLEAVGQGFLLKHRSGQKTGMHVGDSECLRSWCAALFSLLAQPMSEGVQAGVPVGNQAARRGPGPPACAATGRSPRGARTEAQAPSSRPSSAPAGGRVAAAQRQARAPVRPMTPPAAAAERVSSPSRSPAGARAQSPRRSPIAGSPQALARAPPRSDRQASPARLGGRTGERSSSVPALAKTVGTPGKAAGGPRAAPVPRQEMRRSSSSGRVKAPITVDRLTGRTARSGLPGDFGQPVGCR